MIYFKVSGFSQQLILAYLWVASEMTIYTSIHLKKQNKTKQKTNIGTSNSSNPIINQKPSIPESASLHHFFRIWMNVGVYANQILLCTSNIIGEAT